jgi:hypothetical protein
MKPAKKIQFIAWDSAAIPWFISSEDKLGHQD